VSIPGPRPAVAGQRNSPGTRVRGVCQRPETGAERVGPCPSGHLSHHSLMPRGGRPTPRRWLWQRALSQGLSHQHQPLRALVVGARLQPGRQHAQRRLHDRDRRNVRLVSLDHRSDVGRQWPLQPGDRRRVDHSGRGRPGKPNGRRGASVRQCPQPPVHDGHVNRRNRAGDLRGS